VICVPVLPDQKEAGGTYSPAANAWKAIPGPEAKVYDAYPAMAYDVGAKLTVYFGMRGDKESATWVFDGAAWKDAKPEKQPPARKHPGMCYAPEAGGVVLVGGVGKQDTWKYDAKANACEEIPAPGLPPLEKGVWGGDPKGALKSGTAYYCDALAYDPEARAVTLFDATIGVWALKLGNGK